MNGLLVIFIEIKENKTSFKKKKIFKMAVSKNKNSVYVLPKMEQNCLIQILMRETKNPNTFKTMTNSWI